MSFLQECKTKGWNKPETPNKPERQSKPESWTALRSIPWIDDEYINADGLKLCYSIDKEGRYIVRLPGGESVNIEQLQKRFKSVRMPFNPRTSNFA